MIDDGSTDGTVTRERDGLAVIRFERHLPNPAEVVWSALTEPHRLLRWWGQVDIDPRPGGRFDVTWLNPTPDGDRFTMCATITAFDSPRLPETHGDAARDPALAAHPRRRRHGTGLHQHARPA